MKTSIRLYSLAFLAIIGIASMAKGQMAGDTEATDTTTVDSVKEVPETAIVDEVIWVVGDEKRRGSYASSSCTGWTEMERGSRLRDTRTDSSTKTLPPSSRNRQY